ncbi:hypothetical protein RclHR1_05390009 [Rhizophagus clarus]|uniref:Uncharacterized protein n=1 Tax=Rhizophagus clarus TaxID=94130 RepID=A0A2Z6SER6_9GLOM|nr:hypothetical protein RclHR1_05390009 [Rhizophagus clarus]
MNLKGIMALQQQEKRELPIHLHRSKAGGLLTPLLHLNKLKHKKKVKQKMLRDSFVFPLQKKKKSAKRGW